VLAAKNLTKKMQFPREKIEKIFDEIFALAERGAGFIEPNPKVGAILIFENGEKIAAFHEKFGEPHAEILAIEKAEKFFMKKKLPPEKIAAKFRDATLFVNLEPCAHRGKTPSCARKIIEKKIGKVFIAARDVNLKAAGGAEILRENGVAVFFADAEIKKRARKLNEIFYFFHEQKMPFCAIKMALSLDGKISKKNKRTQISNSQSQKFSHFLRLVFDAILIGAHTAKIDDPNLSARNFAEKKFEKSANKNPHRIIFDGNFSLKNLTNLQIFRDENFTICVSKKNLKSARSKFPSQNVAGFSVKNGEFQIAEILQFFAEKKINSILVEGGARTAEIFVRQKIAQKFYFFIAPKNLGEKNSVDFFAPNFLNSLNFKIEKTQFFGGDALFSGDFLW